MPVLYINVCPLVQEPACILLNWYCTCISPGIRPCKVRQFSGKYGPNCHWDMYVLYEAMSTC